MRRNAEGRGRRERCRADDDAELAAYVVRQTAWDERDPALAKQSVITKDEALDFVRVDALPSTLRQATDAILDPHLHFDAEIEVSGATTFALSHPTTQGLALALGWSQDELAVLWRSAYALT